MANNGNIGSNVSGIISSKLDDMMSGINSRLEQVGNTAEKTGKKISKAFNIKDIERYNDKIREALDYLNNNKKKGANLELFNINVEDLKKKLIHSWNEVVKELPELNVGLDDILSSSPTTKASGKTVKTNIGDVYKYSNVLRAMGIDISEISSEISDVVSKMESMNSYQSAYGHNFDLKTAKELYEIYKFYHDLDMKNITFQHLEELQMEDEEWLP